MAFFLSFLTQTRSVTYEMVALPGVQQDSSAVQTFETGFWAFLAWYGIATISMGVHDQITGLRSGGD